MTDFSTYTSPTPPPPPAPSHQQVILMALSHMQAGRMQEAEQCFRYVAERDPNPTTKFLLATMLPPVYQSMDELLGWRKRMTDQVAALHEQNVSLDLSQLYAVPTFTTAYQGLDDLELHRSLTSLYRPPADPELPKRASDGKIRVGFISTYFREHTIGRLNHGLVEKLSRDQFLVTVFSIGKHTGEIADSFRQHADSYVELTPDVNAARGKILEAGLDILLYTDLGMEPVTYTLAFSRLAPVQCVTWGHPDTTSISTIDYFISSEDLDSPDAQKYYSERLARLPLIGTYYQRPNLPENPKTRADFGVPDDATLYGCPQSLYKFHPEFDAIIANILRGDPKGLLVLLKGQYPTMDNQLMGRFVRTMTDVADRVRFVPRQDRADFLSLTSLLDVSLDPIHFGGGNTSYEAFALGTPIVTMPFKFLRGRIAYAQYCMMGMIECIAETPEQYVEIALKLGMDKDYRASVSQKILESNQVLFENPDAVRGLEKFFKRAVRKARETK